MTTFFITLTLMILVSSCEAKPDKHDEVIFKFELYDGLKNEDISLIQNKLNGNIYRIMSDLKVGFSGTFIVHVWNDNDNYLSAQENYLGVKYPGSSGYVIGPNELALLFVTGVEENAEHEMAHCVSLHVQNDFGNNPRWLWEAVAIYEAGEFHDPQSISYLKSGNYPTINELNGDFNADNQKIYEVGYLIIEFILHEWGKDELIQLIKNHGHIENVLGIPTEEFVNKWKLFVDVKYFNPS